MIKIEHVVLPSAEQMKFVIEGMRNPLNSWARTDSRECQFGDCLSTCMERCENVDKLIIGDCDFELMKKLASAGKDHRKFMRMIPVMVRITAGHTFWAEFDTYKVGTVRNSCSKMHKIHVNSFTYDNFDHDSVDEIGLGYPETFKEYIKALEELRITFNVTKDKKYWRSIIDMLPMSYHLTANVTLNYEVLANMYHSRRNHKMDEWREFCKWIETLPLAELIVR